jgi:LemA protein
MNTTVIFLLAIIILAMILFIYAMMYNAFQNFLVRINEVESNIDNTLRTKYDTLIKALKGKNKNSNLITELEELKDKEVSTFDFDRELITITNKLYEQIDSDKKQNTSNNIKKVYIELGELDERLSAYKQYYDDNISQYNRLVKMFPTNFVAKVSRLKEKNFFEDRNLNDKNINDFKV